MPVERKIMSGFEALSQLPKRGEYSGFTKLGSLLRLRILSTPPDNEVNVRFLTDDFALVQIHGWVQIKGKDKRQNILCKKSFDRSADCPLCDANLPRKNVGICRVGLLDAKEEMSYDTYEDVPAADYAKYAEVMDEKNIIRNGDTLTLTNIPSVRLLEMGAQFWRNMATFNDKYGGLCNRPYTIYRQGERLETTYTIAPSDKDMDYKTPEILQMQWEPGLDFCMSVDDYIDMLSRDSLYEDFEGESENDQQAEPSQDNGPSLHDMLKG